MAEAAECPPWWPYEMIRIEHLKHGGLLDDVALYELQVKSDIGNQIKVGKES